MVFVQSFFPSDVVIEFSIGGLVTILDYAGTAAFAVTGSARVIFRRADIF